MEITKSSLAEDQGRLVEIIDSMEFGVIEGLQIRGGLPCYEPEPRIFETIKLDLDIEQQPHRRNTELTLKKAYATLFDQLMRLSNGVVNIEVRHSLPFRIVLERRHKDLL